MNNRKTRELEELVERFFNGDTTTAEEARLYRLFRRKRLPAELERMRPMFAAFASMQLRQTYEGRNFTLRRLRRILSVGDVFFILSAVLMLEDAFHFLLPLFQPYGLNGYNNYVIYVQNNWVVLLLAAAIIEIYATHRISHELKKEEDKSGQ